jgi:hypothetical protein
MVQGLARQANDLVFVTWKEVARMTAKDASGCKVGLFRG